ncbi:MAG TPA: outer membrane lipoprotein-sorting protein, partial [bacterium]|nr:outer membrane lipoprotein-sorting protein [bacterium]
MKKLLLPALILWAAALYGQEMTGEEIIRKANDTFNVEASHATMEMTIVTSSGDTRTFVYESWSKDEGEKNLIRYLEPRRVQGQATLMLNNADDIWMYFPRTGRV